MKTAFFCDFDGTITRRDVGYNLFRHFSGGRNEVFLPDWKSGKMTTRDCLRREADLVKASADEILRYIDQFEIDEGFTSFVELCGEHAAPLFVVSDGLDFYIRHILAKNSLDHLPISSNRGILENGGIRVEFPRDNISCRRCGICKGEAIEAFRNEHNGTYRVVFVGDGYSDACAARRADILFAKKDLEEYCLANHIHYYPFNDFFDVRKFVLEHGYLES